MMLNFQFVNVDIARHKLSIIEKTDWRMFSYKEQQSVVWKITRNMSEHWTRTKKLIALEHIVWDYFCTDGDEFWIIPKSAQLRHLHGICKHKL